jgi:Helicase conserved C-terminal domain
VHRGTVERRHAAAETKAMPSLDGQAELLIAAPGPDDEPAEWSDKELLAAEADAIEAVTALTEGAARHPREDDPLWRRQQELLDRMQEIAERSRDLPDAKALALLDWIRANQCLELPPYGQRARAGSPRPSWNDTRVLIFTESREGTKRWLQEILEQAIESTDRAEERIAVITGLTSGPHRQEIQRRFNADPEHDPLRILIATDAAREGLNFQAHCADLFHFDLPWNPGRIEQRNGRIDRKLQPAAEVRCHYFVLAQRAEDRVLDVLVRKTNTIRAELGSLSKVIDNELERRLRHGISHRDATALAAAIESADLDAELKRVAEEEFEQARERQDELNAQIERCQTLLERSRTWVSFDERAFRDALSRSLELLGAEPLKEGALDHGLRTWRFPPLDRRAGADASWAATLDTLRPPKPSNAKLLDWRREAPVRPVVFEDEGILTEETVHLHLEQRVAQRLLGRFRAQGFVHHDLSRACLAQVADSIPRVVLLGRLTLYGRGAERLHEVLIAVAARWLDPDRREGPLAPYARDAERRALELLGDALGGSRPPRQPSKEIVSRLLATAVRDVEELVPRSSAERPRRPPRLNSSSSSAAAARPNSCATR